MQFSIIKENILPLIQHANNFTSSKGINTILENILIETEEEEIQLKASNTHMGFSAKIKANIEETGITTVSCKKLHDIIKELPNAAVIDFKYDGSKLKLTSGKSKFTLSTIEPEFFPTMTPITPEYRIKMKSESLEKLLQKTTFCISNDPSKTEYTGAHFKVFGNKLEIGAADFQRIATAETEFDEEFSDEFTINIPKKTAIEISKLLDLDDDVEIETDKKQVQFQIDNIVVYSKLIEKFIKNIGSLFKTNYPISAKIPTRQFEEVVRRISTITSEVSRGIVLSFNENALNVFSLETEYGQGNEIIDGVKLEGESIDIIFNSKLLLEIINHIDSEFFTIKMIGRKNPAIIVPENGKYQYLLVAISIDRY
ncbi:MAG: DNA polymerase III subunit beta [Flexistipes sinusarabici]|uniref:Beta sliding clamp n=1 Tax=Flexistipes sinusarabici TaxID=2352 RepID=A0A5D0ML50_FLESI|nr:DNA polymerase III subunit beta [Flexistipes sinusarabici]TYB32313.1 MAG: DNA polymerase III subunit beta [Flexistipes sinusarabici]